MSTVILTAKSRHGKNRIHEHGDVWSIEIKFENRILVRSTKTGDLRNICIPEDPDFFVNELQPSSSK